MKNRRLGRLAFAWVAGLAMTLNGTIASAQEEADMTRLADGVVRFLSGSSKLTPESERTMDRVVKTLERQSTEKLLIVGHTDRHGNAAANRKLSRQRAEVVKAALVKRGLPANRFTTIGAGFSEPLSNETTADADNLNRRVELWVGIRNPLAWVSWIFQEVEAKKPEASIWNRAELRMALGKLFRVRTTGQSAGEVTFTSGHRIYLGPEALVVIYGRDDATKNKRVALAEVRLEEGAIFSRLRAEESTPLVVVTPAAKTTVTSREGARVEHSEGKKRSTMSIYEGNATVSAKGQSVAVDGGYGTRVKNGQAPEEPTPLIPAPTWTDDNTVFVWGGTPIRLAWKPATGAGASVVDLTTYDDAEVVRPTRVEVVEAEELTFDDLPAGAYRVRVSSFDEREILGLPSKTRTLLVLKGAKTDKGEVLDPKGGPVPVSGSETVALTKLDGFDVVWTKNGIRVDGETLTVSGGDVLKMEVIDKAGKRVALREWSFRLSAIAIQIDRFDGPTARETFIETSVEVTVTTLDGTVLAAPRPIALVRVPGMLGDAPVIRNATDRIKVEGYKDPPFGSELSITALQIGKYRITRTYPLELNEISEQIAFVFPSARAAAIVELPKWQRPAEDIVELKTGPYVGIMGGVQFRNNPTVSPWFSLEAGFAALSVDRLRVTLGVQAAFMPTKLYNGATEVADMTVVPIFGRVAVALSLGVVHPYVGVGVGVRLVSVSGVTAESLNLDARQFAVNGLAGVGFGIGNGELFVEGAYGKQTLKDLAFRETIGDLTLLGGFRWFFY